MTIASDNPAFPAAPGAEARETTANDSLAGQRVALVGRLGGMSKREAQQLVRQHGGSVAERADASTTLLVVGERELPLGDGPLEETLDDPAREAVERGTLEVIGET